ncbi:hypothetical protein BSKO_00529 [Bryopsis sp. KO-2023]|nr:hypothetical protein BSKO_00529 [Bryopsis sp. KO-2023]
MKQIDGAVVPNRYPYAVVLQHRQSKSRFCQGVLIEEDLILTAAHCVDEFAKFSEKFPLLAIGGANSESDADTENRRVCRTIIHDQWEGFPENGYDIALLELNKPSTKHVVKLDWEVNGTSGGRVIHREWKGETLTFLGWEIDKDGNNPVVMNQTTLEVWSEDRCQRNIRPVEFMDSMMCAKAKGVNLGVCSGDSGGPLVQANEGCGENDVLAGALSFGPSCNNRTSRASYADVFTKVSSFRDWIEKRGKGDSIHSVNANCHKPLGQTIESEGCMIVEGVDMNAGLGTMNCGRRNRRETPEECCQLCRDTKDFLDQTEGQYLLGMKLTGSNIAEYEIAHEEECCNKCKKNKKCKAYEILGGPCYYCFDPKVDPVTCRRCLLKDSIPEPEICASPNRDCNSAVLMTRVDESDDIHLLRELIPGLERRYHMIDQATIPGPCRMLVGVAYKGDESLLLNDGKEDIVNSPEECCQLCREHPDCWAWTIITVKTKNEPRGACYLREEIPAEAPCSACTSGIIEDRYKDCTSERTSSTAPYSKILSLDVNSETEEPTVFHAMDCCQECRLREGCNMWSFCIMGQGGCYSKTLKCEDEDARWGPYGVRCSGSVFPENACMLGWSSADAQELSYDPKGIWASGTLASAEAVSLDSPCALLAGTELFEGDLEDVYPMETPGPVACCEFCLETAGCKSWSRDKIDRICFLKGAPGVPLVHPDFDSGVVLDRVTQEEIRHLSPVVTKPKSAIPVT